MCKDIYLNSDNKETVSRLLVRNFHYNFKTSITMLSYKKPVNAEIYTNYFGRKCILTDWDEGNRVFGCTYLNKDMAYVLISSQKT